MHIEIDRYGEQQLVCDNRVEAALLRFRTYLPSRYRLAAALRALATRLDGWTETGLMQADEAKISKAE